MNFDYLTIKIIDDLEGLPEVQAGKNLWQNKWHRHDVYEHTVEVVRILKELKASPELIAAGWLHDIGKPPTKVLTTDGDGVQICHPKNGQPYHSFPGHENKGEEMVNEMPEDIFRGLGFDRHRVARIVGYHFKPMERVKEAKEKQTFDNFGAQVRQLSDELDHTGMRHEVLTIFYADKASQQPEDLEFLLGLREYLLHGKGDLHGLFGKFISAYSLAENVWVPLPHSMRRAIQDATELAFVGRAMTTTLSGETVLLEDVHRYNNKAEGPLASVFQKLNSIGQDDVAKAIQLLYPRLIPYFIGCGTKNPVHHTSYVLEFMVTILIGEKKIDNWSVTICMLAVLFHDVAQGLSKLKKITENNLKDKCHEVALGSATLDKLDAYLNDAVSARKEHMEKGAQIAAQTLSAFRGEEVIDLPDDYIETISRIVGHHDDPKIPVAYRVISSMFQVDGDCGKWLSGLLPSEAQRLQAILADCRNWRSGLSPEEVQKLRAILDKDGRQYLLGVDDWLLQYHHEADLLWMVTQDGIDADLARFSPAEGKTPRQLIDNNIGEHQREVELYRDLPNFADFDFQDGTAYRSPTGHRLFKYLTSVLKLRNPG